jgi:hypothetical protein
VAVPLAVNDSRTASSGSTHLAPVINIRLEPKPEARAWKWIGVAVVLGAVASTILANIAWQSQPRMRADFFRSYRPWLQLTADDDYASAVRKMGAPLSVHSSQSGDRTFQSLVYPKRRYSVILMGPTRDAARYIGTIDAHGRVIDALRLRDGSNSEPLLHSPALR